MDKSPKEKDKPAEPLPEAEVPSFSRSDEVRFSKGRTLDHEVMRLRPPAAERRRSKRLETVNEELLRRQTEATERTAFVSWLALAVATVGSVIGVLAYFKPSPAQQSPQPSAAPVAASPAVGKAPPK